jgi:uncharacterized membrane-anchored protein
VVGLIGYTAKGVKVLGVGINPELVMGLLVPVVVGGMWFGLRCMHQRLHRA